MKGNKTLLATLILIIGLAVLLMGGNQSVQNQRAVNLSDLPESRLADSDTTDLEILEQELVELQTQTILSPQGDTDEAVEEGDTITVHYRGWLASNGEVFDASFNRNQPFTFTVGSGVIEGWSQGVIGMKVGEVRRLKIPAELGYGESAVGSIPANSDLVFDVELLEIR